MEKLSIENIIYFFKKYINGNIYDGMGFIESGIHIKSEQDIEDFMTLLIFQENACMHFLIDDFRLNYTKANEKLKYMEKYEYERDYPYDKENDINGIYNTFAIYENWKEFKQNMGQWDCFSIRILLNKFTFLKYIHGIEKSGNQKEVKNLYENTINQTGGKTSYAEKIKLIYPLEDSLTNKSFIFRLLEELSDKRYFNFDVNINDFFVVYELTNINNISLEAFVEDFKNITGISEKTLVEFKNNNLYVNGDEVLFDKKDTNIFKILKLFFELAQKNKSKSVSYEEMDKNKHEVGLDNFKFNYTNVYDSLKNRKKEIEREFNIKSFIGIKKDSLECQYLDFKNS